MSKRKHDMRFCRNRCAMFKRLQEKVRSYPKSRRPKLEWQDDATGWVIYAVSNYQGRVLDNWISCVLDEYYWGYCGEQCPYELERMMEEE